MTWSTGWKLFLTSICLIKFDDSQVQWVMNAFFQTMETNTSLLYYYNDRDQQWNAWSQYASMAILMDFIVIDILKCVVCIL